MEPTNSFLTVESLATLGGATLATVVVANTYRAIFKKDPRIFALLFSIAVCVLFAVYNYAEPLGYVVAFINGCLVYCTAFGLNTQVASMTVKAKNIKPEDSPAVSAESHAARHFFDKW
jgi:hypothetical protein